MKIAFDAKRAFLNKSGLGNYSRTIIKSLIHFFPENQYELFTPKTTESDFLNAISVLDGITISEPEGFISKNIPALWRTFELTEKLTKNGTDIYHGLSNELPANITKFKGKKIVTIHDLIFLRYPELYPIIDREIYDRKFRKACEHADWVVAISEQTKKDLQELYRIPEKKIKVVYQSCDEVFHRAPNTNNQILVREKYNLPQEYLLSVGTIEERKNLLTLLKALILVENEQLVVVGKKRDYFKEVDAFIQKNKLQSRVLFLENVETNDLPAIYHLAKIFIYPSLFEGFGIPVLEAITCKTPVIAAYSSSLPEAGGRDSMYFEPTNHEQLVDYIRNILNSETQRKNMIEKGFEYSQKFKPEKIAQEMMKVYLA